MIPCINGSASFGIRPPEDSRLGDWARCANERESVARTSGEAAEGAAQMGHVAELVKRGDFRREYRDHRLEWMVRSGGLDIALEGLEKDNIRFNPPFGT